MDDMSSDQEVPTGVLDLLRIFLAARSRGEDAILILETRKRNISTKYRSSEHAAGAPAAVNNPVLKRKKRSPARVLRSRLRMEKFMKEKVDEKLKAEASLESQVAGSPATRLLVEVDQDSLSKSDQCDCVASCEASHDNLLEDEWLKIEIFDDIRNWDEDAFVESPDLSPNVVVEVKEDLYMEKSRFYCNFCDFRGKTMWDVITHTRKMHHTVQQRYPMWHSGTRH